MSKHNYTGMSITYLCPISKRFRVIDLLPYENDDVWDEYETIANKLYETTDTGNEITTPFMYNINNRVKMVDGNTSAKVQLNILFDLKNQFELQECDEQAKLFKSMGTFFNCLVSLLDD